VAGGPGDAPRLPELVPLPSRLAVVAVSALVFGYLTWFRVSGLSSAFMLLGDQIRDWAIALGPASDLPLAGAPSMAGGRGLGPVYYWVIWASRVVVGPWCDNLPHAGGIGISLLQGTADVCLLVALWRRLGNAALAVATVVFAATAPLDAAYSASIWNPPVAVAFTKLAIAFTLVGRPDASRLAFVATAATAWLAVQAHSSALFAVAPALAWLVCRPLLQRRLAATAWAAYDVTAVIVLLQVPFFLHHVKYGAEHGGVPGRAMGALPALLHGDTALKLSEGASALLRLVTAVLTDPWRPWLFQVALVCAAVAVVLRAARIGVDWMFVTVLPLLLAAVAYAPFPDRRDYWYLALAPGASAMLAAAIAPHGSPKRAWRAAGWLALAIVLVIQPGRYRYAHPLGRLPEYKALVAGSRQILRDGVRPRAIDAAFRLDTTDPGFLYTVLGGTFDPQSKVRAEILPNGGVRYRAETR
jgi:hypothetical protein